MLVGFLIRDRILPLGSFANKKPAVRLLTNDSGHPVSIVALNNGPHDFNIARRHLVLPVAELTTTRFLTKPVQMINQRL